MDNDIQASRQRARDIEKRQVLWRFLVLAGASQLWWVCALSPSLTNQAHATVVKLQHPGHTLHVAMGLKCQCDIHYRIPVAPPPGTHTCCRKTYDSRHAVTGNTLHGRRGWLPPAWFNPHLLLLFHTHTWLLYTAVIRHPCHLYSLKYIFGECCCMPMMLCLYI